MAPSFEGAVSVSTLTGGVQSRGIYNSLREGAEAAFGGKLPDKLQFECLPKMLPNPKFYAIIPRNDFYYTERTSI